MANKVVKESGLAIFVKDIQVAASGADPKAVDFPKSNDLVAVGAVAGLVGQRPRQGEDGTWHATVDTAALVRVSGVSGKYDDKAPVYFKASDKSVASSSGAGLSLIGYADRAKTDTAAGDLWVQLVPRASA